MSALPDGDRVNKNSPDSESGLAPEYEFPANTTDESSADTEKRRVRRKINIELIKGPKRYAPRSLPRLPTHVDFDLDSVERGVFGEPEDTVEAGHADLLEFLSLLTVKGPDLESCNKPVRAVGLSFIAVCFLLRLDFVKAHSLRSVAAELGITAEGFRAYVTHWSTVLRVAPPAAKSALARERMSSAQLARHYAEEQEAA
ncbi:hypothetical protein [Oleiharenicola lentus]|uniref:hypothetical protein n=1 Tax=Oleiharenicola lentus TaxID=2508720 RepID=UPI003F661240